MADGSRRRRRLVQTLFVLAFLAAILFAVRFTVAWVYWSDPARVDQDIAEWMTPGYVARSWSVPHEVVLDALGTIPDGERRRSLGRIAEDRGESFDALRDRLQPAIEIWRAGAE